MPQWVPSQHTQYTLSLPLDPICIPVKTAQSQAHQTRASPQCPLSRAGISADQYQANQWQFTGLLNKISIKNLIQKPNKKNKKASIIIITHENLEQNYNNLTPLQQTMAQEWVESHPELNPESRSYDKHLAEKVAPYINNLESNIK